MTRLLPHSVGLALLFIWIPAAIAGAQSNDDELPDIEREELRSVVMELENDSLSGSEFSEQFDRALGMADDVRVEQQLRARYANRLPRARRLEALHTAGATAELLGNLVEAISYYERAAELADAEDRAAIDKNRAALLLELGRAEEAETVAAELLRSNVSVDTQREAALLLARIRSNLDRHEAALELLVGLSETRPLTQVDPGVLLALYEAATRADDGETASRALRLLSEHFPESPEYALLQEQGGVSYFPTPSRLFSGEAEFSELAGSTSTEQSQPGDEAAEADPGTAQASPSQPDQEGATGVQTGSFTTRANAEAMARELDELGFASTVSEISIGDTAYYRVIVPAEEGESATDLQFRLKTEGYDGLLMFSGR